MQIMEGNMTLNKKVITGITSIVIICIILTCVAVNNHTDKQNDAACNAQGIITSAGAVAHIQKNDDLISAGASSTVMGETVVDIVDMDSTTVGQPSKEDTDSKDETDLSQYDHFGYTNLGLAVVDGNLNVRNAPGLEGEIVGKMTNHAACEILGVENGWYKITSGSLEGYVTSEYMITGEEALIIAQNEAELMVTVTTDTLNVRKAPSTDSSKVTTVSKDADLYVLEILDGWIKIQLDTREGYISSEYVTINKRLKTGSTLKELQYGEGVSEERINLVNYALEFVGNRYVWGGESLTHGVDCSGFTMKIYEKFGVYLPHYSGSQPAYGERISAKDAKPGDLFFYASGSRIDHVAIYIGNGQIVHAASTKAGIIISSAYYSTPVAVVSYLD